MMDLNFLYLARRYLYTKHHDATIRLMIKICFLGILVATCSLALVVSIMTGFETATYQKMKSIYPDLIIDSQHESIDMEFLSPILDNHQHMIKQYAPQHNAQGLLLNNNTLQTNMLMIRGINPHRECMVSNIEKKIINPQSGTLINLVDNNHVIIGQALAKHLELNLNDTASLLYSHDHPARGRMIFQEQPIIIAGIFKTGIDDIDMNVMYIDHNLFEKIFDDSISSVHLSLQNTHDEHRCIEQLKKHCSYDIYSWKDLYPTLLSALKLEKWAMFMILLLIVFVASMNIMSLISMYISQKKRDIAILLSFGMPQKDIRKIFITMSLLIAGFASTAGLGIAFAIGKLLQKYPFIKLPDNIYDTDFLPIQLELPVFCVIFILTLIISLLASIQATRNIDQIKIVEALKTP